MTRHEMHDIRGEPDHFVKEIDRSTRTVIGFDPIPQTVHETTHCSRNDCDAARDVIYVYSLERIRDEIGRDVTESDVQSIQIVEYLDEPVIQATIGDETVELDPYEEIVEDPLDACHGEDPFEQEPSAFGDDPYEQEPHGPRM